MLSSELLDKYNQLKKKRDAAYTVFKKTPTIANTSRYTTASQIFTAFCVETMRTLAGETSSDNDQEEILANIANYRSCKQCNTELLYQVDDEHFIESSEFVKNFPGWCHSCLISYCCSHQCEYCGLSADPANCSYKEIRSIYLTPDE